MEICDDTTTVKGIKEKSRPAYIKKRAKFRLFHENSVEFKAKIPYFKPLRTKKMNGVIKHEDYIQHDKFNHQEKILIIYEVFSPEKLVH